jgi:parallel beta-helix repeat protein
MKKLFLFVFLGFISINAQFITPGTGVQWTLDSLVANSAGAVTGTFPNYTVAVLCSVSVNDRLIIPQGSIVTFSATGTGFVILGAVEVNGVQGDSVYFKGATENPQGAYEGFYFRDTGADTTSIIKYAVFVHGYYPVRCLNSSPRIYNSRFYKCRRPIYMSSSSNPVIKYNYISEAYEYGIYGTTGSSPIIEYNELYNNNSQNTSPKNQITFGTQNTNSPRIRFNKIHGGSYNRTGGISISALLGGSASSSEIAFNEIYNNSYGIALAGAEITSYVHNNLIYNNNINSDPLTTGSGISISGNGTNRPIVSRNTIYGNLWGITVYNGSSIAAGPTPSLGNLTNADTSDDGYNKIYGNFQTGVPFDLFNNCTNDIYAQNNDWGVYDSAAIDSHITHKVDDPARGWVYFTPFIDSSIVPVELESFSAHSIDGTVRLNWTTASELNNAGFVIERKSELDQLWSKAGYVTGKGTTTSKNEYSFTDKPGSEGTYSYRLRQIDFDGTSNLSMTVFVEFTGVILSHQLNQNYPNPFNPETVINYTVGGNETQRVALRIYDALGAEVTTLVEDFQTPGNYSVKFNTQSAGSNLASGVYLYELTINSTTITKKLIVNK